MMSACGIEAIINAEREMSAKLNNWWTQTLNSEILYGKTPEVEVDKEVEAKANEILKAEFAEKLGEYPKTEWAVGNDGSSYMYTYCPKCGRQILAVKLKEENDTRPEHLLWWCQCEYRLLTKTKDAQ